MGLFGDDRKQDARLDALESHVRSLTEDMQQDRLDIADIRISLMKLQGAIKEKVSIADVDPELIELNKELAEARRQSEEIAAATSESWDTLQTGARQSFETLRSSIQKAAERMAEIEGGTEG